MKKIPTLFERVYEDHKVKGVLPEFTDLKCAAAFYFGKPTVKFDGSCCAIIDGKFYKRYDAKKGKPVPENAIKCQKLPDPITGHMPCWVPVDKNNPADKWFIEAYTLAECEYESDDSDWLPDGTYEAVGKHFQGDPYNYHVDTLIPHGSVVFDDFYPQIPCNACLTEDDCVEAMVYVHRYLALHNEEGIVFWLNGEPVCKIKRSDFGLEWPIKEE
jgi:hypothetical protein